MPINKIWDHGTYVLQNGHVLPTDQHFHGNIEINQTMVGQKHIQRNTFVIYFLCLPLNSCALFFFYTDTHTTLAMPTHMVPTTPCTCLYICMHACLPAFTFRVKEFAVVSNLCTIHSTSIWFSCKTTSLVAIIMLASSRDRTAFERRKWASRAFPPGSVNVTWNWTRKDNHSLTVKMVLNHTTKVP